MNGPNTYLHQAGEVLQHARHGKLQEVVVSQVESREINSGKDAEGEAPQQVGVQEQQLEGRHGVEGPGVDLADLVVLKIKVPKRREDGVSVSLQKDKMERGIL